MLESDKICHLHALKGTPMKREEKKVLKELPHQVPRFDNH